MDLKRMPRNIPGVGGLNWGKTTKCYMKIFFAVHEFDPPYVVARRLYVLSAKRRRTATLPLPPLW